MNISIKCHQGKGQRGEAVMRTKGCPPRPRPGVKRRRVELYTRDKTESAGSWVKELVVGVEDPLEMSDTEQGDIARET